MQTTNLALRFLLELAMLAALGYWGLRTGQSVEMRWLLGLGAPLLAASFWGLWVAPASARRLPMPWRLRMEEILFGAAVLALIAAGQPLWALIFALLVVVNRVLMNIWNQ